MISAMASGPRNGLGSVLPVVAIEIRIFYRFGNLSFPQSHSDMGLGQFSVEFAGSRFSRELLDNTGNGNRWNWREDRWRFNGLLGGGGDKTEKEEGE